MSRIVKSSAVVDDREIQVRSFAEKLEADLEKMPVIKKGVLNYRENPYAIETLTIPNKQGYLDELNRVKTEIAQAKAELRSLGRQIEEALEEQDSEEEEEKQSQEEQAEHYALLVAQAEAERLLRETRQQIDEMKEAAVAECERLAEQAKNEGYLEGFEKGFAQATAEYKRENEPRTQTLNLLLKRLADHEEELVGRSERDILELSMTVARKVVGQELKSDSRAVAAMLYEVLDQNRREEEVRITVSPELMPVDAKVNEQVKKIILQTAPGALIYIDKEAPEGTCVVETGKGITDLSVDTQLTNIQSLLTAE